jgi:tetratricopeptide (TPR) repeat protein
VVLGRAVVGIYSHPGAEPGDVGGKIPGHLALGVEGVPQDVLGGLQIADDNIIGALLASGVPAPPVAPGLDQIAEKLFLQAIDDRPHDAVLYNRLGVALRRQQKHRQALDCYQQALKLDPRNEKVYFNLGVLYFDLGEKEKALEALRVALKLHPDFPEAQDFLQRHYSN